MKNKSSLLGQSTIRKDAQEKTTGKALYVSDIPSKNLKHASIFRSNQHHALIKYLDISPAYKVPGVIKVITAKEIPGEKIYGEIIADRPVLAENKVRFWGEPIAIVIAENQQAAEEGKKSIRIEYQPLKAFHDPMEAWQDTSTLIHDQGNLLSLIEINEGNTENCLDHSAVILEETFQVPRIYPAYLEPESSLAEVDPSGKITVWVSSQKPFQDRDAIARVLGLSTEQVIVKSAVIGGAFGGKEDSNLAILTALAAWAIKGNVRIVNSREESFLAHPKRHPAVMKYRIGADKYGYLQALEATIFMDTGAYASYGPAVGQLLTECACGAYRIPNVKITTRVVYTNSPICGAMRGFGSPQVHFAIESLMDILAHKLNLDPGELRKRNIWIPGDRSFTRVKINQPEAIDFILQRAIAERERLKKLPVAPHKIGGVGIALAVQTMGLGFRVPDDCTNRLEWLPDGKVLLALGAPDLGQGLATVAAQMTADALEIPYEDVIILPLDTSHSPDGGVTCASRMTYSVGNSVLLASQMLLSQIKTEAGKYLKADPSVIRYEGGFLINGNTPIPVNELLSRLAEEDIKIEATATFSFPYGPETPDHLPFGMPHVLFCFGAHVVRIEVDPLLGKVEVKDVCAIHDVGKVIHRQAVEGQIEGGILIGLGYALSENLCQKPDGCWVDNFTEYLLPTSMDMPEISISLYEFPEHTGPHGVKGIGEISLVPTAPAIANAIFDALGVRVKSIPVHPQDLIR